MDQFFISILSFRQKIKYLLAFLLTNIIFFFLLSFLINKIAQTENAYSFHLNIELVKDEKFKLLKNEMYVSYQDYLLRESFFQNELMGFYSSALSEEARLLYDVDNYYAEIFLNIKRTLERDVLRDLNTKRIIESLNINQSIDFNKYLEITFKAREKFLSDNEYKKLLDRIKKVINEETEAIIDAVIFKLEFFNDRIVSYNKSNLSKENSKASKNNEFLMIRNLNISEVINKEVLRPKLISNYFLIDQARIIENYYIMSFVLSFLLSLIIFYIIFFFKKLTRFK